MARNLDVLQLAFAYHTIQRIIGSDAQIDEVELSFLHGEFPPDLLRTTGFIDPSGRLTPVFLDARDEALRDLPSRLTQGQKLALLDLLIGAAASDGVLAAEEADVLFDVARSLSVEGDGWRRRLDQLLDSGRIRRDDAGV